MRLSLRVPFCEQLSDSAACGPCCLKMVLDYLKRTRNGKPFTKAGLVKLAKTSAEYGTDYEDMVDVLKNAGLTVRRREGVGRVILALHLGHPIIALVQDPGPFFTGEVVEEYHYVVLTGYDRKARQFKYHDPYYGKNRRVSWPVLVQMMAPEHWMIEVSLPEQRTRV